ncbi:hypothetical protein L218DRAFT_923504 [Marasmius fiardii PR-910]|nr:hypothetical protein L218DRAFT_923504 [Marasmius fiardii PR-910]
MASIIPTRVYQVVRNEEENSSISLALAVPTIHAENLYLQTWGSSFVLANLLHKLEDLPFSTTRSATMTGDPETTSKTPIDFLELGAGTGLVGLSAASIFRSSNLCWNGNGKIVTVLTDLPTIVPGLAQNLELNKDVIGGTVFCGSLDWNSPNQLVLHSGVSDGPGNALTITTTLTPENEPDKALVILAADTMYTDDHPQLLSQTIFTWLRKVPEARAVICYPMRIAYLDAMREFWEVMETGGLVCVKEGREELGEGMVGKEREEWDDEKLHEWSIWQWKESLDST